MGEDELYDKVDGLSLQDKHQGVLVRLREIVEGLYIFKDRYFENHQLEEAANKMVAVKEMKLDILKEFLSEEERGAEEGCGGEEGRAEFLYLKGRLLNVETDFSQEAEDVLSRAVKLNPSMVTAWNELGESYTRKQDFPNAKICFEGALQHQKNKVSLRSLSMVLRQISVKSPEEKVSNIEESLVKGKEAVALDTQDGMSWSILGNAYFAHFFLVSQNPRTLKQAMSAYSQAEKDIVCRSTPELHYNRGIALKYEELYEKALKSFSTAQVLDPTWDGARHQEENLIKYLDNISSLITLKGKLKPKKISSLLEGLDNKNLGPYSDGLYKSPSGLAVKLNSASFKDLSVGLNSEKVVLGRVICSVYSEETVPFTFCIMDLEEMVTVVTLYNLSPGRGVIIGDTVAVPEPFFTPVNFSHKQKAYNFGIIRVESPLVLVINGKKAGKDLQAGVQMTPFTIH